MFIPSLNGWTVELVWDLSSRVLLKVPRVRIVSRRVSEVKVGVAYFGGGDGYGFLVS